MVCLTSERLDLRDHVPGDLDALHAWLSDPAVTRYVALRSATRAESQARLDEALRENDRADRTRYFFAVVLRASGEIIGEAGFTVAVRTASGGLADLGYFLLPRFWGQGYATEALQRMVVHCFTALNLHKVTAGCDAANHGSEQVMQKCGLVREAYRRRRRLLDGVWRDTVEYALLKEDWERRERAGGGR